MKTKNLIKALEKNGLQAVLEEKTHRDYFEGGTWVSRLYVCKGRKKKVTWHDQDGNVTSAQVQKHSERNEIESDYFPGYFAHTIKEILEDLLKD